MYQPSAQVRDRASSDLDGYGDLSAFVSTTKRSDELDEQSAIALIMGDEDFLVGDGTLDFPLREEDRTLLPPLPGESSEPVSQTIIQARSQPALPSEPGPSFVPIEDEMDDEGDEVARIATMDALARLEKMAAAQVPELELHDDVAEDVVDAESKFDFIQDSPGNDVVEPQGGDGTFGGMGSGYESDTPTPFALPKLPGAFDPYVPSISEAVVETQDAPTKPISAQVDVSAYDQDQAVVFPQSVEDVQETPDTAADQQPDEFAPFEVTQAEEVQPFNSLDPSMDDLPSYTSAPESKQVMYAAEEEINDHLPPTDGFSQSLHAEEQEQSENSAYSVSRVSAPTLESIGDAGSYEPPFEPDSRVEPEDLDEENSQAEHVASAGSAAPQSFFQKNRNIIVVAVVVAAMMGWKQYTKYQAQADSAGQAEVEATIQFDEAETVRLPQFGIPASSSSAVTDVPPDPYSQQIAQPTILVASSSQPQLLEVPRPSEAQQSEYSAAKLAELADRLSVLEAERNKLREENEALKAKKVAVQKPKVKTTLESDSPKADVVRKSEVTPSKPQHSIQYLGTFHEGDRLVAEVLIDGRLARVRRGDVVSDGIRVEAVGDMSVTINDVVYSP